jgi:hypothetical protein
LSRGASNVVVMTVTRLHWNLPDSDRERFSLRRRPWHSMVRRRRYPHRLRPASTGLLMPTARRDARADSPRHKSQRIPHGQTSTSEVPDTDQSHGHDGYTWRNCQSVSSSLHECGLCVRPKDEKDIVPLASRSCGRSLASLYGAQRPHSALAGLTPDEAYARAERLSTGAKKQKNQQQQKLAA